MRKKATVYIRVLLTCNAHRFLGVQSIGIDIAEVSCSSGSEKGGIEKFHGASIYLLSRAIQDFPQLLRVQIFRVSGAGESHRWIFDVHIGMNEDTLDGPVCFIIGS
jgi:hypothetical protein